MKRFQFLLAPLTGLIAGLGGETLLFARSQCARAESELRGDFKVVLFLKSDAGDDRRKALESKLLALPGAGALRYVSREEALAELRRDDPELAKSVTLLGENPLNPAFEAGLTEDGVGGLAGWLAAARGVEDWADVRYKEAEVRAILQAQFYRRVLEIVLNALLCLAALLALHRLWLAGPGLGSTLAPVPPAPLDASKALASGAGAAAGAALCALLALPMRLLTPWWAWPSLGAQALLLAAGGMAGWALCRAER
jgi:hypothetical protein